MSYRVAVLVSGEGTNLQAILDTVHGHEGTEVVCVGSNKPRARGLERAREAGVETGVFESGSYRERAERDSAMGDWLEEHDIDLLVLAGFMEILSAEFIRRFEGRIVNVHPSLLPAFPGIRAIEQAIEAGVRVSGVTVHFVDEGVDSGPIILQQAFELPYPADIDATEEAIHAIEHELLPRAVKLLARGAVRIDPGSPRRVLIEERADVGGH
ncbi:MAG TPA: phosphoribosylglycinamide formyltransferase [Thermoleophilaceae bacterium]|nr:phosphoribosylglycinamide formyltransferase [Thermoleophilaceae bacterium]